jgi:hypothetical protein
MLLRLLAVLVSFEILFGYNSKERFAVSWCPVPEISISFVAIKMGRRPQGGVAREHELEAITAELFKQCLEDEGWRQRAELFADKRVGRHLFQTA